LKLKMMIYDELPSHKKYTLASRTKQSHKPKLAREYFFFHPRKIKKQKNSLPSKNKTSFHRTVQTPSDIALNINRFGQSVCKIDTSSLRTDRRASGNSTYPKGGVSCSKDSFVVHGSLVFQIKFCGKSPALRVAANRQTV